VLPTSSPFFFERLYLVELEDFINDGIARQRVPCYINTYRDNRDLLFSMIFCTPRAIERPDYRIMHNATGPEVLDLADRLSETHVVETLGCYFNGTEHRCVAVFRPDNSTKQIVYIRMRYDEYQQRLLLHQDEGFNVYKRKIYYDKGDLSVDVIFQTEYSVSFQDAIDITTLQQLVEVNQQRGLYLADGNARLENEEVIYSTVFTTQTFGNCEYRVEFNLDALLLFNLERQISPRCHILVIIPTTGDITPLYTAVFWCQKRDQ